MNKHRGDLMLFRARLGMFIIDRAYSSVCAFVDGYNMATGDGLLAGFREWLLLRLRGYDNLSWQALVLQIAFPKVADPYSTVQKNEADTKLAIDTLFALLLEFLDTREVQRD